MQRIMRTTVLILLAVLFVAGCSKKVMKETPPPAPQPKVETPPPPAPPPPPPPAPKAVEKPRLEFQDAFFDFDKYNVRDDARDALTADGRMLMDAGNASITIEGHCDERGTVDYNLALGEKRANAAKEFLISYGIAAERIKSISYGKSRPFALGHDETAWAQNRRAHLVAENQ